MRTCRRKTAAPALLALTFCLLVGGWSKPARARFWPSQRSDVASDLASNDVAKRRRAAGLLLRLPTKEAGKFARMALRDADTDVRLLGARAAAALRLERAGDEVVPWLREQDSRLRLAASALIRACPTDRSVLALTRALGDAMSAVRQSVADSLGASGRSSAVGPLLGRLDDRSEKVRIAVVRALKRLADKRAVLPLIGKLQDGRATVRAAAARALGALGDRRATMSLIVAMQNARPLVQIPILQALGRLGNSDAGPAIEALLRREHRHTTPALRDAALFALVRCAGVRSMPTLLAHIASQSLEQLAAEAAPTAVQALQQLGRGGAVALQSALAASSKPGEAARFAMALARLSPADAALPIVRAARRGHLAVSGALRALELVQDPRALPYVMELVAQPDETLRGRAVFVAIALLDPRRGDGRAVDVVGPRLKSLSLSLGERLALVRLLGRTGAARAVPYLLAAARSSRRALRHEAIVALSRVAQPSEACDAVLLKALNDRSVGLRAAAASALAKVGRGEVAATLLQRLRLAADQDRVALSRAFSGTMSRSRDPKLVPMVQQAVATVTPSLRDALIEGLGRMAGREAGEALVLLASHPSPSLRRKVAEALRGHPSKQSALRKLSQDPSPSVAANAVWSLGQVGDSAALSILRRLIKSQNAAVAANAALSLGLVAGRQKQGAEVLGSLCSALLDDRSYIRSQALMGLGRIGLRCSDQRALRLLENDPVWSVRVAAARLLAHLLRRTGATEATGLRRALGDCVSNDRDAEVAAACMAATKPKTSTAGTTRPRSAQKHDVVVYVVPAGQSKVLPNAEFALVLPDGFMRFGLADERGAVFERAVPGGRLRLAIPASQNR